MIENKASLSHSFIRMLDECQRRAFFHRHFSWGGWSRNAPATQRAAYAAKQLTTIPRAVGRAIETECRAMLAAEVVDIDASVARVRTQLSAWWVESRDREAWLRAPKKRMRFSEHEYGDRVRGGDETVAQIHRCLTTFAHDWHAKLRTVEPIAVAELESFVPAGLGVAVYAIPDFAWWAAPGELEILDLKTGKRREDHALQLGIYALWGHEKLGAVSVKTTAAYLQTGEREAREWEAGDLDRVRASLVAGLELYRGLLVDGDLEKHEPKPIAEWAMAREAWSCRGCSFRVVCPGVPVPG